MFMDELRGEVANETLATEKALEPIRTGELRESTDIYIHGNEMVIGPVAPHAVPVARGVLPSKRNPILPRKKKALFWKGATHPVKAVYHHPGMRANPFDLKTVAEIGYKINRMADVVADRYLTRWS